MRYKITARGVYDKDGKMIEIGDVVSAPEGAGWLVGKAETIGEDKKRKAVTNPAVGAVNGDDTISGDDNKSGDDANEA